MNNSSVLEQNQIVFRPNGHSRPSQQSPTYMPSSNGLGSTGFEQVFVPHGSALVTQGAALETAFYILSGWVLEEEVTRDGEVAWADIILRGEVAALNCISTPCERGAPQRVATATISALTDVFAVRLPRCKLDGIIEDDRAFARMLHDTLRRQSVHLHDQLVALSAKTAHERVVLMLRSLQKRAILAFGTGKMDRLPVSQVVLSRIANISVVHMNRIAQKLRQDGVLDWNQDGVRFLA